MTNGTIVLDKWVDTSATVKRQNWVNGQQLHIIYYTAQMCYAIEHASVSEMLTKYCCYSFKDCNYAVIPMH